jgi:hypothetical protein
MNMTLFNDVDFSRQLAAIWDSEDITEEERQNMMNELVVRETKSIDKLSNMLQFITSTEGFITTCKFETERIQQNRASAEKLVDYLKKSIRDYMLLKGKDKITAGTYKLSLRNSESVEIVNADKIPGEYKTIHQEITVSKTAIKDAIKNGKKVPGALLKSNSHLQVR